MYDLGSKVICVLIAQNKYVYDLGSKVICVLIVQNKYVYDLGSKVICLLIAQNKYVYDLGSKVICVLIVQNKYVYDLGSKVICVLIAQEEGEPGTEATSFMCCVCLTYRYQPIAADATSTYTLCYPPCWCTLTLTWCMHIHIIICAADSSIYTCITKALIVMCGWSHTHTYVP